MGNPRYQAFCEVTKAVSNMAGQRKLEACLFDMAGKADSAAWCEEEARTLFDIYTTLDCECGHGGLFGPGSYNTDHEDDDLRYDAYVRASCTATPESEAALDALFDQNFGFEWKCVCGPHGDGTFPDEVP